MDEMSAALARLESKHHQKLVEARKIEIAINELKEAYGQPASYPDVEQDGAIKTIGLKLDPSVFQVDPHGQPKRHKTLDRWKLKTGPKPKS
jgi:hypothetical protein